METEREGGTEERIAERGDSTFLFKSLDFLKV